MCGPEGPLDCNIHLRPIPFYRRSLCFEMLLTFNHISFISIWKLIKDLVSNFLIQFSMVLCGYYYTMGWSLWIFVPFGTVPVDILTYGTDPLDIFNPWDSKDYHC